MEAFLRIVISSSVGSVRLACVRKWRACGHYGVVEDMCADC